MEEIIQDTYAFYNKSAKRQRRLHDLAQQNRQESMEDKAIQNFENAVTESLQTGIILYLLSTDLNIIS